MAQWTAKADPTKEFFIDMITRDIGLDECIFDLLDNSIDGASRSAEAKGEADLSGYYVDIVLRPDCFSIVDNCGGMSLLEATDYAFHFGRRSDAPKDAKQSIGLYGIGMKRAIFKMGKSIVIQSSTEAAPEEAFEAKIDVDAWAQEPEWEFGLDRIDRPDFIGTKIAVTNLKESTASEFSDDIFISNMRRGLGRYYSFFLQDGIRIAINGVQIVQHVFGVRSSEAIAPFFNEYTDAQTGVSVKVISGLAGTPPDDAGDPNSSSVDSGDWGWYVVCNKRIVLAGDKTDKTVWGGAFPSWHSQYNGFMGLVFFTAEDPKLLPWTTTKRQIDETLPVFRRATTVMRDATRHYVTYTNSRKANLEEAKVIEERAVVRSISEFRAVTPMKLPTFSETPKIAMGTVSYQQPRTTLDRVARQLGNSRMSLKQIGLKTFEYYVENEVGE